MKTQSGNSDPAPDRKKVTSIGRFLKYVKPYRGLIFLGMFFGIIRYVIPLVLPWTLKLLVDEFLHPSGRRDLSQLHWLMGGLVVLYLFYGVISYFRSYVGGLAGQKIIFDLREKLYLHVQKMSISFFDSQRIGSVVSRMTTDIAAAQNFVGAAFINTAMDMVCVGVIVILLFFFHWELALVALSVIPSYVIVSYVLTKKIKAKSRDIHNHMQEISGVLHEQFAGISTIQSFNQEEAEAREFQEHNERYFGSMLENLKLQSLALGITGFLTALGPILVLWYGTVEVWQGRLSVGTLMAFYAYLAMLYQPIQRLTELNLILTHSLSAMDRIFEVFDTYPEIRDIHQAKTLEKITGDIEFENVTFLYDSCEPVLTDFNLEIASGSKVALVGPSGSGKSTVVKLLARFYDVTEGRILVDLHDIREMNLKSLRESIAVVAQEPILFSDTIRDNLRYGKPDATDEEIWRSAKAAFADRFIERLPKGLDTPIGERGVRLSGGERQRLAIARALLKNAPIIILDEPTSALDPVSEELIKEALKHLLEGRTALIIAHRLSTIEDVDRIVVLDEGKVIEEGRHEDLLKIPGGLYRRFVEQQMISNLL